MGDLNKRIDDLVEKIRARVSKEPMTPLDRAIKVYTFDESLDHAFGGFAFWHPKCVGVTDVTAKEFYTDPEKFIYCQLFGAERFEHDLPAVFPDMYNIDIEACGSKLHYPEDSMPVIKEHVVQKKKDLLKLKIPDFKKDGRGPYIIDATNLFREKVGDIFYICVATNAPWTGVTGLRDYRDLYRDLRDDPLFVHELLEYILEVQIGLNKLVFDAAGFAPVPCDARAAPPLISPQQWEEFALPYATRLLEAIKSYAGQRGHWFLGWGYSIPKDQQRFLRMYNSSGTATCFLFEEDILGRASFDKVDLGKSKEICLNQKVVLATNPMPQSLFDGPPDRIKKLVTDWHRTCASGGGHEYYTTVPVGTPPEHVEAYVGALKDCLYPVQS